jgi:hypothetical protein
VSRPELDEIVIGDPAGPWERLGFVVGPGDVISVGGVRLRLTGEGGGIRSWALRDIDADGTIDLAGMPTTRSHAPPPEAQEHPNGAFAVDHVVTFASDLAATTERLKAAGLDHRPTSATPEFFVVGASLLEVVQRDRDGFWGVAFAAPDLDVLAAQLGDLVGEPKDAVQPGRRVVSVRREAGVSVPLAFMTPRN